MDRQIEQLVWRRAQRRLSLEKSADQPQAAPLPGLIDRLKKTASLNEDVASLSRSVQDACERFEEDWTLTKEAMERSGATKLSDKSIHILASRYSNLAKLAGVDLSVQDLEEAVIDTTMDGVFDAFSKAATFKSKASDVLGYLHSLLPGKMRDFGKEVRFKSGVIRGGRTLYRKKQEGTILGKMFGPRKGSTGERLFAAEDKAVKFAPYATGGIGVAALGAGAYAVSKKKSKPTPAKLGGVDEPDPTERKQG